MRFHPSRFIVVTLFFMTGPIAKAEPDASQQALANQLFDDAERLMASNHASEACPKYAESQRLDPQLGTMLHLATCFDKIGKTASAWSMFKDAADIAQRRHDDREAAVRQYIANLEQRLSRLTIDVAADAPSTIEVRKDGDPFSKVAWGTAVPIDPGPHIITAHASGYKDWQMTVDVPAGATSVRTAIPRLEPLVSQHASPNPGSSAFTSVGQQPRTAERSEGSGSTQRTVGYLVGGVGVVGLVVGTVSVFALKSHSSDRDEANACSATHNCTLTDKARVDQLTNDMRTNTTFANIGFVGGGLAMVGGLALVLTAPSSTPKAPRARTIDLQPWVGRNSTGLALGGVW